MMKPAVGRIVWFKTMNGQIQAAIICHVHSADEVNLCVLHADGTTFARHHVALAQDRPAEPLECEWMSHERQCAEADAFSASAEIKAEAKARAKAMSLIGRAEAKKDKQ